MQNLENSHKSLKQKNQSLTEKLEEETKKNNDQKNEMIQILEESFELYTIASELEAFLISNPIKRETEHEFEIPSSNLTSSSSETTSSEFEHKEEFEYFQVKIYLPKTIY